jgi:hypothetical protein
VKYDGAKVVLVALFELHNFGNKLHDSRYLKVNCSYKKNKTAPITIGTVLKS